MLRATRLGRDNLTSVPCGGVLQSTTVSIMWCATTVAGYYNFGGGVWAILG